MVPCRYSFKRYSHFPFSLVVPLLSDTESVKELLTDCLPRESAPNVSSMATMMVDRLGSVSCKTALRIAERCIATGGREKGTNGDNEDAQMAALAEILDDLAGDEVTASKLCEVF